MKSGEKRKSNKKGIHNESIRRYNSVNSNYVDDDDNNGNDDNVEKVNNGRKRLNKGDFTFTWPISVADLSIS